MRNYETICIINPDLADEDYQAMLSKSRELIEKQKGVIVKVQEWGKQKLAYPVKKHDKGSYFLVNYCGDPGVSTELERNLRLDDRCLKFMTVKLQDNVDPETLLQKEREAQEKTAPPTEGDSSGEGGGAEREIVSTEGEDNE